MATCLQLGLLKGSAWDAREPPPHSAHLLSSTRQVGGGVAAAPKSIALERESRTATDLSLSPLLLSGLSLSSIEERYSQHAMASATFEYVGLREEVCKPTTAGGVTEFHYFLLAPGTEIERLPACIRVYIGVTL